MAKNGVKLSPPWCTYVHYIESIFKGDPDVSIRYSEEDYLVQIFVDKEEKYEAIRTLMPSCKAFGNVTLTIQVVPADEDKAQKDILDVFKKAFKGNPNVKDIVSIEMFGATMNYIVFKKEVVQFFNDDLTDLHGAESTLNEIIAKELFDGYIGINFCTDTEG